MADQEEISLFVDGQQTDNDPALSPKNTLGETLNGNLISTDGHHYSWETTEGTYLNWSMPLHIDGGNKFLPIGWFRMGNDLVVHSTDDKSLSGGDGEIGLVTFDNAGQGTYESKYYSSGLKYTQAKMIEGYGLVENDAYHRAYWTDNFNQGRTINLAAAVLNTPIASGSLIVGQKYMVLTNSIGNIVHSGTAYGPKQTAGNVFTAVSTIYTSVGDVSVIKYLDVNILNYTPEKAIGNIDFVRYISGRLFCGVKMYAYRLSTLDGYQSSWTFTTNPIHVAPTFPSSGFQSYQGGGSGGQTASEKGIQLIISDIPAGFDKIQVGVFEVETAYQVITSSSIFWDSAISGTSMIINHLGQENLGTFIVDDLTLSQTVLARFKTIITLKQRQIIGNLTTREELPFTTLSGVTINPFIYELPADDHGLTSADLQFSTIMCPASGVLSGNILPGGHYVVRGGTSVQYPIAGSIYTDGQTFTGISGSTTFTALGGSIVRGCIRIKQYTTFGGNPVYKIIDLMDEFFDYRSMASHMYLKGYWREETYRTAAVFLDKFGNPFAARYLGSDAVIPSQSDVSGTYKLLNNYGDQKFSLNAIGLEISGIDITAYKDKISGIMIVRIPRDKTILGQGMLWQNAQKYDASGTLIPNTIVPISTYNPAFDYHGNIAFGTGGGPTTPFRFGVMGPEFDFDYSALNIALNPGDQLVAIADYEALNSGDPMQTQGVDEQVYSKYYNHNIFTPAAGTVRQSNIQSSFLSDVALTTSLTGGYTLTNSELATWQHHPGGLGAAGELDRKTARGGRRTIITIDATDFINGSNSNNSTGTTIFFSFRKLLVNYKRPNNSPYGGNSDNAIANGLYIPTGHYLKIDDTVLADINDGSGNYVLNGMQVFGGDCFVNLYDRVNSVFDDSYNSGFLGHGSFSYGVIFPIESAVNIGLREGRHFAKDGMHNNTNGVWYALSATRHDEEYKYNIAYSSENVNRTYVVLPVDFRSVSRFPYRARYSQIKVLGEQVDNMRVFLIDNFKDVDALHGEINNLLVGGDRLFYMQDKGIGYFPVEERETTTGALGQAVQLGIGGVMQRADQIDKFYGNQHQWGVVTTETGFQWFDMRRKGYMNLSFDGEVIDISTVKGRQTFFQNVFKIAQTELDPVNIFNSDTPLLGFGIVGVYDSVKKTTYMTFKFSNTELGRISNKQVNRDFTVAISMQLAKFVGNFSLTPGIYIEHNSMVFMAKEARQAILSLTFYNIYEQVSKNGTIYVCYNPFTTSGPIAATEQPDYPDSLFWKKATDTNEIHKMYAGDICNFFGIVYPSYINVSVNPAIGGQKTFDSAEVYGNEVALTDVFCNTESESAADENITSTNRNYKYYDGKWNFNLPIPKRNRLTGQYVNIKLQIKNYLDDITVSLNTQKRIVYLKTLFRFRK